MDKPGFLPGPIAYNAPQPGEISAGGCRYFDTLNGTVEVVPQSDLRCPATRTIRDDNRRNLILVIVTLVLSVAILSIIIYIGLGSAAGISLLVLSILLVIFDSVLVAAASPRFTTKRYLQLAGT